MTHEQFTRQYLPLCGKMYALAYNLLRDRNEARDCVQDVYAELWNKRDTMETDQTIFFFPPFFAKRDKKRGLWRGCAGWWDEGWWVRVQKGG